jgi:hypothetical protein
MDPNLDFDPIGWLLNPPALTAEDIAAARAEEAAIRAARYIATPKACPKCGGSGKLDHFRHVANGDCFNCAGTGALR